MRRTGRDLDASGQIHGSFSARDEVPSLTPHVALSRPALDRPEQPLSGGASVRTPLARVSTRSHHFGLALCHGKPTLRGLRYPVESILELLAGGMRVEDVLADYGDLVPADILAAPESGAPASEPA